MFRRKIFPRVLRKSSNSRNVSKRMNSLLSANGHFVAGMTPKPIINMINYKNHNFQMSVILNKLEFKSHGYNFSNLSDVRCWNCHQYLERKKFNCVLCGALQFPKENTNYFELFGMTQTFDMDLEELSTKFKNMQMAFHPDKFINKSKTELEISEMYSRLVNKAYTTLKDPLRRGFYLLELRNLPVEDNFIVGQDFLNSIMEKNEELESILNETILDKFMKANYEEISKHIGLISQSFHYNNWTDAKTNLMKLNYLINLDNKIKGKRTDILSNKEK